MKWIIMRGLFWWQAAPSDRSMVRSQDRRDFERDFAQCEVQARMVPFEHSALTFGSLRDDCVRAKGWRRAN
jgi:hypothetical protein